VPPFTTQHFKVVQLLLLYNTSKLGAQSPDPRQSEKSDLAFSSQYGVEYKGG
jgi:hypothetical protein